ncbi:MAG TPA: ROK family transcriptional regulator [Streptosporangiaceae bacterium]|nr:ROK family transcriptional regulator [Streptosporangiaceae bacterium]
MRLDSERATTSADLRAHNLARLLRAVHDGGGARTRAELTRQLSLARGTATVLVRDLADRGLIEEIQLPADVTERRSRGRPTGVPSAHPDGPVVLAVDLRDDSFSLASFELTGRGTILERQERAAGSGSDLLTGLAARLAAHRATLGSRLVGIGVAVPSPVSQGQMVQPGLADWRGVDVAATLGAQLTGPYVAILVGNDARLAGLAEARRGGLRDLPVALHLHLATGLGGVLLSAGIPLTGVHGAAGEFGHMPLTGGTESCRCGSVGCWELDAGSHGLLRRAGRTEEGDRVELALSVIAEAATDPGCARALTGVADALGRGLGTLVNAHDPAAIGLSGLGRDIFQAAPEAVRAGYAVTLMRFRRDAPPPLITSQLGDLGVLTGAAELVFDSFLTPSGLTAWPATLG